MDGSAPDGSEPRDEPSSDDGPALDEAAVADHLRRNPEFLAHRPDLVEELVIPHASGGAVSLIEYQVGVLRESNAELRRRLRNLVRNARENEDIGRRIHRLTLSLLQCNGLDETCARLYQAMAEEFQADATVLVLVAAPAEPGDARLGEFRDASDPGWKAFESVLKKGRPSCGPLRRDQLHYLLGPDAAELGSAALIPLGPEGAWGLLAVCSRSAERFSGGAGFVFLKQLGDIVSHALSPFLSRS